MPTASNKFQNEEYGKKIKITDDPQKGIKIECVQKMGGTDETKNYEAKDAKRSEEAPRGLQALSAALGQPGCCRAGWDHRRARHCGAAAGPAVPDAGPAHARPAVSHAGPGDADAGGHIAGYSRHAGPGPSGAGRGGNAHGSGHGGDGPAQFRHQVGSQERAWKGATKESIGGGRSRPRNSRSSCRPWKSSSRRSRPTDGNASIRTGTTPLFLAALLLAPLTALRAAESKPNVLFLFADDQRADTIAALGNPDHPDAEPRPAGAGGRRLQPRLHAGRDEGATCVPSRAMLCRDSRCSTSTRTLHARRDVARSLRPGRLHHVHDAASGTTARQSLPRSFQMARSVFAGGMTNPQKRHAERPGGRQAHHAADCAATRLRGVCRRGDPIHQGTPRRAVLLLRALRRAARSAHRAGRIFPSATTPPRSRCRRTSCRSIPSTTAR